MRALRVFDSLACAYLGVHNVAGYGKTLTPMQGTTPRRQAVERVALAIDQRIENSSEHAQPVTLRWAKEHCLVGHEDRNAGHRPWGAFANAG